MGDGLQDGYATHLQGCAGNSGGARPPLLGLYSSALPGPSPLPSPTPPPPSTPTALALRPEAHALWHKESRLQRCVPLAYWAPLPGHVRCAGPTNPPGGYPSCVLGAAL